MTDILSMLDGVRDLRGGNYMARCPAHDDRSPSLSVKVCDDGRVLVHCFAGCEVREVLGATGLQFADLFPDEPFAHRLKPTRPRILPRDALRILDHEAIVVGLIASDIIKHQEMTEEAFDRLAQSVSQISRVREATRG